MELGILCMVILITGLLAAVIAMYFSDSSAYHRGHGDGFDAGWKAREEYEWDLAADIAAQDGEPEIDPVVLANYRRIYSANEATPSGTPSDVIRYTNP